MFTCDAKSRTPRKHIANGSEKHTPTAFSFFNSTLTEMSFLWVERGKLRKQEEKQKQSGNPTKQLSWFRGISASHHTHFTFSALKSSQLSMRRTFFLPIGWSTSTRGKNRRKLAIKERNFRATAMTVANNKVNELEKHNASASPLPPWKD